MEQREMRSEEGCCRPQYEVCKLFLMEWEAMGVRQKGRGQGTAFKRMTQPLRIRHKLVRTN